MAGPPMPPRRRLAGANGGGCPTRCAGRVHPAIVGRASGRPTPTGPRAVHAAVHHGMACGRHRGTGASRSLTQIERANGVHGPLLPGRTPSADQRPAATWQARAGAGSHPEIRITVDNFGGSSVDLPTVAAMEITLTVHLPRRRPQPVDVVVEWSGRSTAAELCAALSTHLGEPVPGLSSRGREVAADSLVGMPPLLHGASVAVSASAARTVAWTPLPTAGPSGLLDLVVVGGPDAGRSHPLVPPGLHLGRAVDDGLVVADESLSRCHLFVGVGPSGVSVEDCGSTNGVVRRRCPGARRDDRRCPLDRGRRFHHAARPAHRRPGPPGDPPGRRHGAHHPRRGPSGERRRHRGPQPGGPTRAAPGSDPLARSAGAGSGRRRARVPPRATAAAVRRAGAAHPARRGRRRPLGVGSRATARPRPARRRGVPCTNPARRGPVQ